MRLPNKYMALLFASLLMALFSTACGNDDDDDDADAPDDDVSDDDNDDVAEDDDADDDTTPVDPCPDGPEFDFNTESFPMVVPYPNNLYSVEDPTTITGRRVQIDGSIAEPFGQLTRIGLAGFLVNAINTMNGFSPAADLYLPLSVEPDPETIPDEMDPGAADGLVLMAADESSPHDGEFAPFTVEWKNNAFFIRPYLPLHENTRYVLAATTALSPVEGQCYRSSIDMMRLIADYNAQAKNDANEPIYSAIDALGQAGISADEILSISEFNTLWATKDLDDVRKKLDQLAQESDPEIFGWAFEPSADPNLEGYLTGRLVTPVFKSDGEYWQRNEAGEFEPQAWHNIEFLLSMPAADASADGQPFPIILYGHGVGDSKESLRSLAPLFAENGFAFMGIDFPCHGSRAPIPYDPTTSVLCYFDFLDPLNFRDNLRETISNLMWLARAAKTLGDHDMIPEGGDGSPDYDMDSLNFLAISVGAINGGTLTALEENIDAFVLSSAGAKLSGIAIEGNYLSELVTIAELIDPLIPSLNAADLVWMIGGMFQHVLDAGDPFNYLPHTIKDPLVAGHIPDVLQQCPAEDYMLGGIAGAYANRAAGWPQLEPYVWDVGWVEHMPCPHEGSGFYQFDTIEHLSLWDNTLMGDAFRAQAIHFLKTHKETGVGVIINPFED